MQFTVHNLHCSAIVQSQAKFTTALIPVHLSFVAAKAFCSSGPVSERKPMAGSDHDSLGKCINCKTSSPTQLSWGGLCMYRKAAPLTECGCGMGIVWYLRNCVIGKNKETLLQMLRVYPALQDSGEFLCCPLHQAYRIDCNRRC